MNIWNKVFVGLIFVVSLVFFFLGARALKTHQHWRDRAAQLDTDLTSAGDELETLVESVRQRTVALHRELADRGRVWYGCRPQNVQADSVNVAVGAPLPHQIQPGTVLWAFDQLDIRQGGKYLGQFTVTNVTDQQVQMKPTLGLTNREAQRLQQAAAPEVLWLLCETMPADKHDALAGLSEEELRAVLPENTVEEYLMDGQITTLGEVRQRGLQGKVYQVDQSGEIVRQEGIPVEVTAENERGKFVRQLRDYEELFLQHRLWHTDWIDRRETNRRNLAYIQESDKDLRLQVQYRERERSELLAEKEKTDAELARVAELRQDLDSKLQAMRAAIAQLIETNRAQAGELARIQREATRLIDERTRQMAQAGD
jgi:hypothetical protein